MFCTKCGEQIDSWAKFCTKCGNKIENIVNVNKGGSITFARKKQLSGAVAPIKIYVDGVAIASMSVGEEQKVPISIGKHRITFAAYFIINSQEEIEVTNEHPNIKVNFKLDFWNVTKITSIENV